jgi:uncharacterized ion transporter superfamily protein YfcC
LAKALRLTLPHPLVLLLGGVAIAVALTWVLPAGRYERRTDAATGRALVVPGTYTRVEATPVGVMAGLLAIPRGVVAGADVVLAILIVGGAFAFLEATGALGRLVASLTRTSLPPRLVIACVSVAFAALGALDNTHEEVIALIGVLVVLASRLGFGAITALAMSVGAAVVGAAFGPTNPFQAGIAMRFAEISHIERPALRFGLLAAAVTLWILWTLWMSDRSAERTSTAEPGEIAGATTRDLVSLAIVLVPFVPYVIGVLKFDWGFNELTALYVPVGFAIGLISGRGLSATAAAFITAMHGMLGAALYVGVARGISVALTDGQILDTILHGLAAPLASTPGVIGGMLMVPFHVLLHVPVPSVSGQAVLTMPIMAPLADLLGLSRDAAVLAYQTGAGLMDMITPTNGALLAMLMNAGVDYGRWLRFAVPGALLVSLIGLVGIVLAA